ncbi:MAG: hypothetical protein LBE92_14135 [Chryseobacterium sp.]|uniref:hypothetical protein n=1 Tax=Chryseobacterium sp. TaxID=1871047 RepID=UPI00281DBE01|nr:hypothetical protein [Chryseobacterium sp.]MDR2237257.1 hypothetical protein [Chryseobacterium sp.]
MKKILPFLLLAFVTLFVFSCDDNNDNVVGDGDTYSRMRDITGSFNNSNGYGVNQAIEINPSDVVLVYRWVGNSWQIIPKTYYLDDEQNYPVNRELDYNFQFDNQNVEIYTSANFNQATQMSSNDIGKYLNNQRFRIVLVPAAASKNAATVDTSDYNAVVKYYNLDETKVKTTKVN